MFLSRFKLISSLLLFFFASVAVYAGPVDIYAGAYNWQAGLSGDVASGGNEIDVEEDLGFDRGGLRVLYLGVEHFVPLIPNARISQSSYSQSARGFVNGTFANTSFGEPVRSSMDLEYTDLTLYYTPLDFTVKLAGGLTVRRLTADVEVVSRQDSNRQGSVEADLVVPMLHLGARGDLPLTGFYATGELNMVRLSGDELSDFRAGIGWQSPWLLGVEAGYSRLVFKLDDVDDLDADLNMSGPYLSFVLGF